ncbi:RNA methyltransferase [Bacillus timonensis]|nr:RNA methyltransferase [Bacillus timonensis]
MKRIESIQNPLIKQVKKLHTKKERDKTGLYLIDGFHLVEESLQRKDLIKEIFITENISRIPNEWDLDNVPLTIVTESIMKEISQTETSQGIAAVCYQEKVEFELIENKSYLLIDAVQDPGNLGTMIRTADAAGIDVVIVGEGSVDIYNSKVIRSTQGSIFHLPILKGQLNEWMDKLQKHNVTIYGTALKDAVHYKEVVPGKSFALIVGNEGSGVSEHLLKQTTQNLYIPIRGKSESLNVAVATGVLLYHLT